ncbi:XdhC family protein [Peribacillus cavernae]|uniref:XdhC family protein n=1 Tax=Peribacillus cavernae TaxID=1674310 RepID=A0A3S0U628_9BACI|nr:XdhC family protein [Peribacillus cavernae]MDQ0218754.1 xanthine/CO dehydrogenase XdhC/CoxF family maturation factor [Peribacillus cavernae]RUQ30966.1 XdhC family protein [Peribacillus cavernae]
MNELKMVYSAIGKARDEGQKVAMATVVAVKGSAYRRPGARMIVVEGEQSVGMLGGGCFDTDVKEIAMEVLNTEVPKLRLYNMADDEVWGLGLGCNGSVYVLIESMLTDLGQEWLQRVGQSLENRNGLWIQHRFSKPLNFDYFDENMKCLYSGTIWICILKRTCRYKRAAPLSLMNG